MTEFETVCPSVEALPEAARELLAFAGEEKIWILEGGMGAGKTTFVKALCEVLGVKDLVNSPTFSIVNEYLGGDGARIYHFDCYRLKDEEEALDMGFEEYIYSGDLCLIEWPSKVEGLLPEHLLEVSIEAQPDGSRMLKAQHIRQS